MRSLARVTWHNGITGSLNMSSLKRCGARLAPPDGIGLYRGVLPLLLSGLALSGCATHAGDPANDPPIVAVAPVVRAPTMLTEELTGQIAPFLTAEIRPQIGGIVKRRSFAEGADVHVGQLLFMIEDRLYASAYSEAKAQLEGARAAQAAARVKAQRFATLRDTNAASVQDVDDADTAARQADALVHEREAVLTTARVNLDYTRIVSPVTGRIGRSQITVGALVTPGQPAPLATVQAIGTVYADLALPLGASASASPVLPLPKAGVAARLFVGDADSRPVSGRVEFTDASVTPATQSTVVRIRIDNPDHRLLPGMFVRGEIEDPAPLSATMVPQQAVTVRSGVDGSVLVVDRHDRARRRSVLLGRASGSRWIIQSGLAPGEMIIVAGGSKIAAGDVVRPRSFVDPGANP